MHQLVEKLNYTRLCSLRSQNIGGGLSNNASVEKGGADGDERGSNVMRCDVIGMKGASRVTLPNTTPPGTRWEGL